MLAVMSPRPGKSRAAGTSRVAGCLLALCITQWALVPAARRQEVGGAGRATREPDGGGVLVGRVLVADRPADDGTVVLHRVSADGSGEVDSVEVARGGHFELALPGDPGTGDDVFFATLRHQDVLYFGPAVTGRPVPGDSYVIQAYPALTAGPGSRPALRVRNIFAARPDSGPGWTVADFFELQNAAAATLVAGEGGTTWSHALPPEAVDPRVDQSDLALGMTRFRAGRVEVSAPVLPGENVYLFRYSIPGDEFSIPLEVATGSMELFVREPAGDLAVTGLAAVDGVELEGVRYRRFAGREMVPSVVTVAAGEPHTPMDSVSLLAVFLTLALACAGALIAARSATATGDLGGSRRRRLLVEVARLDEEWAAGRLPAEEYGSRRARLLEELGS